LLIRSNGNVQTYYYKLKKGKKSITVSWAKIRGIKGYQVRTYKVYKARIYILSGQALKNKKQNRYT